jgi:hypothetical protein
MSAKCEKQKICNQNNHKRRKFGFYFNLSSSALPGSARFIVEVLKVEELDLKFLELIGKVVIFLKDMRYEMII